MYLLQLWQNKNNAKWCWTMADNDFRNIIAFYWTKKESNNKTIIVWQQIGNAAIALAR